MTTITDTRLSRRDTAHDL